MCPITVFGIQSVGRNEMCIHASDLTCFGIHHVGKSLYGTTDMFCNCYGRIIVTLKEQRVQKVFQIILLTFLKAEFYLRLRSCIGRYLYVVITITVFQCKNAGEDFRCAGIRTGHFPLFFIKDPA